MAVRVLIVSLLTFLTSGIDAKLPFDSLDELDANLISNEEPPPPHISNDRHWVKFSETPPLVVNTELGARVEIECLALGNPPPEIKWMRRDGSIVQQGRKSQRLHFRNDGVTEVKSRLLIDCVTRKHEGFYTCTATSGSKSVQAKPTFLLVKGIGPGDLELCSSKSLQPPRIISYSPTAMELIGSSLQLPCLAVGNPQPLVYWLDPAGNIVNGIRHQVTQGGDLTISQLEWADMGLYSCVAESPEGRDQVGVFVYPTMSCQTKWVNYLYGYGVNRGPCQPIRHICYPLDTGGNDQPSYRRGSPSL